MKTIKTLLLSCILALASCTPDPCLDVICLNDGVCDDGACLCADWYEGTDCSTEERAKYYGDYIGTATFINASGDVSTSTDTIPVIANGSILSELFMANGVPTILDVSGMGGFMIPLTAVSDPGGPTLNISGYGSFDNNLLTVNATMEFTNSTVEYTFTGTK
tara:strand:+ start:226 stop:711 length:486 start_codon:yes stop_codon:yes gene_type:complete